MTSEQTLTKIFALFESRGWRDAGDTALRIANHVNGGGSLSSRAIATRIAPDFLARNNVTRDAAAAAISAIEFAVGELDNAGSKSRLLLLSADPTDQDALRIQAEQRMIRDELERSRIRNRVELELRPGLMRTDLARYLLETRPAVVHFSGHGDQDQICAEDALGNTSPIPTDALAGLFAMMSIRTTVRLVVLSSCLSDAQAQAIGKSVPAVIGMAGSIADDTALAFSRGLYMALGQELTVGEAFEFGRNAVALEAIPEDKLPVIYLQKGAARTLRPFDG